MTKNEFNAYIEKFLQESGMSATEFGVLAANDPKLVFMLRQGRECREAMQQRCLDFIKGYKKR